MGIDEALGRTIFWVLCCLFSSRPSNFQQMVFSALPVYVEFSRVQSADDIQIFMHKDADSIDQ